MAHRKGIEHAWAPAFTWDSPALYDEHGAACYATREYLEAQLGAPEAGAAPEISPANDTEVDEVLAWFGYERVNA